MRLDGALLVAKATGNHLILLIAFLIRQLKQPPFIYYQASAKLGL